MAVARFTVCYAGQAAAYGNLGLIHKTRGDLTVARDYWTKARDLFAEIGMPHMVEKMQGLLDEGADGGEDASADA